jgi:hypothetical protein
MIKEQYIKFKTAKLAKKKGFNVPCRCYYSTYGEISPGCIIDGTGVIEMFIPIDFGQYGYDFNFDKLSAREQEYPVKCSAPTQSLLSQWLREVHKLFVHVEYVDSRWMYFVENIEFLQETIKDCAYASTYEEAMENGLIAAMSN